MSNWFVEASGQYDRKHKFYVKKRPNELKAVLNNLATYYTALSLNGPQKINAGFIHNEPHGVKAVDQKGYMPKLQATRLYFYPDVNTNIVHLITIGDKNSQKDDINFCNNFIKKLRDKKNG